MAKAVITIRDTEGGGVNLDLELKPRPDSADTLSLAQRIALNAVQAIEEQLQGVADKRGVELVQE